VAVECLEPEVRHRAVEGVEEPVIYRGKLCYQKDLDPETGEMRTTGKLLTTRRYSDTLLIFLLKAEKPDKYHRWLVLLGHKIMRVSSDSTSRW